MPYTLVAEVKTQSPFGWRSTQSWDELFVLAASIGDIISVHTDARWGGSLKLLQKARGLTDKPILAKGIHVTDQEVSAALAAGADWVLVVGRLPSVHHDKCWVEPTQLDQLSRLSPTTKVVWNSRDLATGGHKPETFADARRLWAGWLCQASNITSVNDVDPAANAILVGSHLPDFARSLPT